MHTRLYHPKNWAKTMQKIKTLSSNAQPTPDVFQTKPVTCVAMPNVRATVHKNDVAGGSHGAICATRPSSFLIGNRRLLHAVAPKDYASKKSPLWRFFFTFDVYITTDRPAKHTVVYFRLCLKSPTNELLKILFLEQTKNPHGPILVD